MNVAGDFRQDGDGIVNALGLMEAKTMNSKRTLMAAMVGLAMFAMPIAASAKNNNHEFKNEARAARVSRQYVAPVRNFGPIVVNKHGVRNGTWMPAPKVIPVREWREHDRGWHRGWGDHDDDDYGYRPYYSAPAYAAPVYSAPAYGYGRNCRAARGVLYNYQKDRATGHPAAAYDLLRRNQWAFHSGCAVGSPYAGGLFGGYGGAPAYGYGQQYGGSSFLTPFLGQFVR